MSNVAHLINGNSTEKLPTLNERIQKASASIDNDLDRLGSLLLRAGLVEEAPPQPASSIPVSAPIAPLTKAADRLDNLAGRLSNLIEAAERIA